MAASAWTIFDSAKNKIGKGAIALSGTAFRLALHKTSAALSAGSGSIKSQLGSEISARGGYTAGGRSLSAESWGTGASAGQQKFDVSDIVFTASGSVLNNVRYAVIYTSVAANSGLLLCYAPLSTAQFTVGIGNTLTIQMNANGVFTLA